MPSKSTSPQVYTFLCACFAALGSALFGYDLAVIAGVLVAPDFLATCGYPDNTYQGFIVSSMLLGAFCGCIPAGLIADAFSRRASITAAGMIFLLGGSLQTGAQNRGMMLAGRFFAGWAIGSLGTLTPLYQSEIAHPKHRGRIMSTFQLFIGIGATVAGWIVYGAAEHHFGTPLQWRLPLAFQMLPAIPLVCITYLLPESPRWLAIKGRSQEALQTLARLHARGDINDAFVQSEYAEMQAKLEEERAVTQSWVVLVRSTQNVRKILLGIILQFSVQMTGISAIQYYAPRIYESVGFKTKTTLLITAIGNIIGVAGEVFCILFLDKTGRRLPLIACNVLSGAIFAICTALAYQFVQGRGTYGQGVTFVVMTQTYNFIFSYGIGPLSWVYPVEIMNTAIRAKGSAITAMASYIANFMIGEVSPIAFGQIGWRYYLVFTVCSMTNALTIYMLFPETKHRSLEEMDAFFANSKWIVAGTDATSAQPMKRTAPVVEDFNADTKGASADHLDERAQV